MSEIRQRLVAVAMGDARLEVSDVRLFDEALAAAEAKGYARAREQAAGELRALGFHENAAGHGVIDRIRAMQDERAGEGRCPCLPGVADLDCATHGSPKP